MKPIKRQRIETALPRIVNKRHGDSVDEQEEIVRFLENRLLDDGAWGADLYTMPWSRLDARQKWLAVWYMLALEKNNNRGMAFLKRLLTETGEAAPPEGVRLVAELIFPTHFEKRHFDLKLSRKNTKVGTAHARQYLKNLKRTKSVTDEMHNSNLSKSAAILAVSEVSNRHAFRTFVSPKEGRKPFAPWEDD